MKVTREQAMQNRERVLDAAARQFRERGLDGIGVAELMQGAGLTHGAFYGQFASKDELAVEAVTRAFDRGIEELRGIGERARGSPLGAVLRSYLSGAHRDQPGLGCVVASVGPETARKGPGLRAAITAGIRTQVDLIAGWVRGKSAAARRERAIAVYAGMVGALVLARAVDDEALSAEILRTVRASLEGEAAAATAPRASG